MTENACIVVFPTVFAKKNMKELIDNIRKILKIKDQEFSFIKRDGPIIIIKANDPVFASSAINLLYGIKRVAIAKQIKNDFSEIVKEITRVGSNLLLKGEKFFVKIEGTVKGFNIKDLEMAATSSLIDKTSNFNIRVGTEENFDKLLYTFTTRSNAYVCIYIDDGLGGLPYGVQQRHIICCVFDELSSIACLESIRLGYQVKIIVCYKKLTDLKRIIKILVKIVPKTISSLIDLEFFKISMQKEKNYDILDYVLTLTNLIAKRTKINYVCLPLTPIIHPTEYIEHWFFEATNQKLLPIFPLWNSEDNIITNLNELGFDDSKYLDNLVKKRININSKYRIDVSNSLKSCRQISVKIGPNLIHEILDSLNINN